MRRTKSWVFGLVGLAVLPGISQAATGYDITGIVAAPGDNFTAAFDLNSSDQVVGFGGNLDFSSLTGVSQEVGDGFLFSGTTVTVLPNFGAVTSDGRSGSFPLAINDSGEIVGAASSPAGDVGFTDQNGTLTNVATLLGVAPVTNGGVFGAAGVFAVNDSGVIGGEIHSPSSSLDSGFIYNGTQTLLPPIVGPYVDSLPLAINASGVAVGISAVNSATATAGHAFLFNGTVHDLGTPSDTTYDIADGINASGNVIIWAGSPVKSTTTGKLPISTDLAALGSGIGGLIIGEPSLGYTIGHAFFYNAVSQSFTDLGTLGGTFSAPLGLNDSGDVVGTSLTAAGAYHAFLDTGSAMVDLNSLIPTDSGWDLITADAINDKGDIVGFGQFDGTYEGYLLTAGGTISGTGGGTSGGSTSGNGGSTSGNGGAAVPLPAAAWSGLLLLGGLSGMAVFKGRRTKIMR